MSKKDRSNKLEESIREMVERKEIEVMPKSEGIIAYKGISKASQRLGVSRIKVLKALAQLGL